MTAPQQLAQSRAGQLNRFFHTWDLQPWNLIIDKCFPEEWNKGKWYSNSETEEAAVCMAHVWILRLSRIMFGKITQINLVQILPEKSQRHNENLQKSTHYISQLLSWEVMWEFNICLKTLEEPWAKQWLFLQKERLFVYIIYVWYNCRFFRDHQTKP